MRVGVVADTHVGENLPELPAEVCEVLAGVDLILHAGDIIDPAVLDALRAVAPVVAVRGNHDARRGHRELPRDVLVRVGGARIGLTHGHRRASVELPAIAVSLVAGRPVRLGFERTMRGRFPGADCVVVGHLHEPIHHEVRGVLLFSPGSSSRPSTTPTSTGRSRADGLPPLPPPAARRGPPAGRGPDRGGPRGPARAGDPAAPADPGGHVTAAGPPPELGEVEAFFRRNGLPHLADSPDFREATLRRLRPLVFGLLIVNRALTAEWVGERPNVLVDVSISGREVIVSEALVRVAAILGGFAALFVAVALATGATVSSSSTTSWTGWGG